MKISGAARKFINDNSKMERGFATHSFQEFMKKPTEENTNDLQQSIEAYKNKIQELEDKAIKAVM